MRSAHDGCTYHRRMPTPESANTRTLALVLNESDWHALRELEPDTVSWLQSRIRERLTIARAADDEEGEPDWLLGDDY